MRTWGFVRPLLEHLCFVSTSPLLNAFSLLDPPSCARIPDLLAPLACLCLICSQPAVKADVMRRRRQQRQQHAAHREGLARTLQQQQHHSVDSMDHVSAHNRQLLEQAAQLEPVRGELTPSELARDPTYLEWRTRLTLLNAAWFVVRSLACMLGTVCTHTLVKQEVVMLSCWKCTLVPTCLHLTLDWSGAPAHPPCHSLPPGTHL